MIALYLDWMKTELCAMLKFTTIARQTLLGATTSL
jgi:hypothetical protein